MAKSTKKLTIIQRYGNKSVVINVNAASILKKTTEKEHDKQELKYFLHKASCTGSEAKLTRAPGDKPDSVP